MKIVVSCVNFNHRVKSSEIDFNSQEDGITDFVKQSFFQTRNGVMNKFSTVVGMEIIHELSNMNEFTINGPSYSSS